MKIESDSMKDIFSLPLKFSDQEKGASQENVIDVCLIQIIYIDFTHLQCTYPNFFDIISAWKLYLNDKSLYVSYKLYI